MKVRLLPKIKLVLKYGKKMNKHLAKVAEQQTYFNLDFSCKSATQTSVGHSVLKITFSKYDLGSAGSTAAQVSQNTIKKNEARYTLEWVEASYF